MYLRRETKRYRYKQPQTHSSIALSFEGELGWSSPYHTECRMDLPLSLEVKTKLIPLLSCLLLLLLHKLIYLLKFTAGRQICRTHPYKQHIFLVDQALTKDHIFLRKNDNKTKISINPIDHNTCVCFTCIKINLAPGAVVQSGFLLVKEKDWSHDNLQSI